MDALAELVEALPAGVVATDLTTLENYRHDRRPGRGRDVRRRATCRVPGRGGPRRPAAGGRRCADAAAPRPARGDGNTHPIIVYTAGDADSERRARAAFDDILAAAIRLGGTITGEHGVGRTKKAAPRRPHCPTSWART